LSVDSVPGAAMYAFVWSRVEGHFPFRGKRDLLGSAKYLKIPRKATLVAQTEHKFLSLSRYFIIIHLA
jgi:hypothetical protein